MKVECTICQTSWHISWARQWDEAGDCFYAIPSSKFVCLNCKPVKPIWGCEK